jgi:hypothetical protein
MDERADEALTHLCGRFCQSMSDPAFQPAVTRLDASLPSPSTPAPGA